MLRYFERDVKFEQFEWVIREVGCSYKELALRDKANLRSGSSSDRIIPEIVEGGSNLPLDLVMDAPAIFVDFRVKQFLPERFELREDTGLILTHQSAVADHISGEDRSKPASDFLLCHAPARPNARIRVDRA